MAPSTLQQAAGHLHILLLHGLQVPHGGGLGLRVGRLGHALVDDEVGNLRQAVYVGFACTVVAALDRIVEQAVYRVVVVLVVLRCVDTALGRDRVGAAGRILNAEYLDVVAQFAERSGCGGASQTRTDDDDVELALVGGAYDLDSCLMVAPLFGQSTGRNFSI